MNILLIEDNQGDVRLIKEILNDVEDFHYTLTASESLQQGIGLLTKKDFDIVILDLGLPDSQGLDSFRRLSRYAHNLPIIVFTGLEDKNTAIKAVQDGAQDYLIKGKIEGFPLTQALRFAIERKKMGKKIIHSLHEKEVLLREIHHRVKNNMQIVVSLLRLQAAGIKDKKTLELFKECQNRIKSIAVIHEKLYQSKNFSSVDFGQYIQEMLLHLTNTYGVDTQNIKTHAKSAHDKLDINHAIPCGLILNELISNCFKHAFPENKTGDIHVEFSKRKGEHKLIIRDTGKGLPENTDIQKAQSFGLQIVRDLVEQLKGSIVVNRDHGTEFIIKF